MPRLESVRVTVFEGKIPIFLFARPLPLEIILSHHVQVGCVGQLCIGCRLLSSLYPDCVRSALFGCSPVRRALGIQGGHATDKKRQHSHHYEESHRLKLPGHGSMIQSHATVFFHFDRWKRVRKTRRDCSRREALICLEVRDQVCVLSCSPCLHSALNFAYCSLVRIPLASFMYLA